MSKLLKHVVQERLCEAILRLLGQQALDNEHFGQKYKELDVDNDWPKSGRFGKVHKVRCQTSNEMFAIKEISIDPDITDPDPTKSPSQLLQTLQEAALLNEIQHQNIVRAHSDRNWIVPSVKADDMIDILVQGPDVPITDLHKLKGSTFFLVFDLYPYDLSEVFQYGRKWEGQVISVDAPIPDVDSTIQYLIQIIVGLGFIHTHKHIHGDVKLDNVLKDNDDTVKIADFGLARPISEPPLRRKSRGNRYHAPDKSVTEKVDTYAFGMIMLELLHVSSKRARVDSGDYGMLRLQSDPRSFIKQRLPLINLFIIEVIVQCLNKDPNRRPSDRVIVDILAGGEQYLKVHNVVLQFKEMVDGSNLVVEEMIFSSWFEYVLLPKVGASALPGDTLDKLTYYLGIDDFPLLQVNENFPKDQIREMMQLFC